MLVASPAAACCCGAQSMPHMPLSLYARMLTAQSACADAEVTDIAVAPMAGEMTAAGSVNVFLQLAAPTGGELQGKLRPD